MADRRGDGPSYQFHPLGAVAHLPGSYLDQVTRSLHSRELNDALKALDLALQETSPARLRALIQEAIGAIRRGDAIRPVFKPINQLPQE